MTPVTFDQYDYFATETDRQLPDDNGWGRKDRPVINVTWDDAMAYTTWLLEKTGRRYRLPSESESKYACSATTTTTGVSYPKLNAFLLAIENESTLKCLIVKTTTGVA